MKVAVVGSGVSGLAATWVSRSSVFLVARLESEPHLSY